MPRTPPVLRTVAVAVVCGAIVAGCSPKPSATSVLPGSPTTSSVLRGRYAVPVELDHGTLTVSPPTGRLSTAVTEQDAEAQFEATDAVAGPYPFAIFGLGVVTLSAQAEAAGSTTTTTVTSTTAAPGSDPAGATTTTGPAPPPTAASSTTAPSLPPGSTVPTVPALPTYRHQLAWVGIVWGAPARCATGTAPTGSTPTTTPTTSTTSTTSSTSSTSATTTPTTPTAGATGYIAVIIDATSAHRVLAYRSDSASACPSATPTVIEPNELVSVPWQPVGPASTAVEVQLPPCGHYYGWTQVQGVGGAVADQVVASVPFDTTCGATSAASQSVDQVVPLGSGQGLVGHAPLGPVQALRALPSD